MFRFALNWTHPTVATRTLSTLLHFQSSLFWQNAAKRLRPCHRFPVVFSRPHCFAFLFFRTRIWCMRLFPPSTLMRFSKGDPCLALVAPCTGERITHFSPPALRAIFTKTKTCWCVWKAKTNGKCISNMKTRSVLWPLSVGFPLCLANQNPRFLGGGKAHVRNTCRLIVGAVVWFLRLAESWEG